MNILASYNWIREHLNTTLSADEFAKELSLKSMSVEKIDVLWNKFEHMVVGIIKEIKAHPNANKLRIAVTDIGSKTVEIVCGGSNLEVGQRVFVALPGAKVKWHGEGELVTLGEAEIRGVKSIGMICAPAEVGFDKLQAGEHEIWDLSKVTEAKAGTPVVAALELNDTVLDIEITTNRPDCMSIIGLAREGAAAVDGHFARVTPSSTEEGAGGRSPLPEAHQGGLEVKLESSKCPRYMAATVKNVKVGPSPWWLQKKLLLAGHRPINNIVDITNLVLHEYGQPLHAFDASKIHGGKIVVREAMKGEKLKALDGKEYELTRKNLIIADSEGALAVAGVMGGLDSGTTSATTEVVFEAATFDAVSVRRTARDLNLYSDSQLVFEKGLSTEALPAALSRALELAKEIAGGEVVGVTDVQTKPYKHRVFKTSTKKIRARIGVEISDEEIEKILGKLGFELEKKGHTISATVPYWRDHDIESEVDLTEEVARIYGYHRMPSTLPAVQPSPAHEDPSLTWERSLKRSLAGLGYTEFFSLSLVDPKDLERYGISPVDAVKLLNPLAEDLSHLRPSLMPSMLRSIEKNQANVSCAQVFELSRVYRPQETGLPDERMRLVVAEYGYDSIEAAFMHLKGTLTELGRATGIVFELTRTNDEPHFHPGRSASIHATSEGARIVAGAMGELAPVYARAFGLTGSAFVIDLDLEALIPHMRKSLRYAPLGEFPVSRRDLSFVVAERTAYEDIVVAVQTPLLADVALTDIYRGAGVDDGKKSLTLSLTFSAADRTLTSEEVEAAIKAITGTLEGKFGAVLRS